MVSNLSYLIFLTFRLHQTPISDDDYEHAKFVWETLRIPDLGSYSLLYLFLDVFLLSKSHHGIIILCLSSPPSSLPLILSPSLGDIFSDFRHMGMAIFGIDPLRQYTTPSFAFKSALKTTGIHIDLLTDSTEYMFFEKSLYGGISYVAHREGIANAKHLPNFQPEAPITHLEYVDVNNLVID